MEELRAYLKSKHGRLRALAKALGITDSAIPQWSKVPAERIIEIERATGIPRETLRPDLYVRDDDKNTGDAAA